jgi:hypothetical protein
MTATVMTWNRQRVEVDANWMIDNASMLHYVQAFDGVWVPACDLIQYEAGRRHWA